MYVYSKYVSKPMLSYKFNVSNSLMVCNVRTCVRVSLQECTWASKGMVVYSFVILLLAGEQQQ